MKLLAIDTATNACSVALGGVDDVILERFEIEPRGHSNLVLDMIESLLAESGCSCSDVDAIVVDSGPGSFTGIRIGLGIAQGLALGADLPVMGISSLMVLAEGSGASSVLVVIDARMGEVYWGRMIRSEGAIEGWAWLDEVIVSKPSLVPPLMDNEIGIGDGWDYFPELGNLGESGKIRIGMLPRASWLVPIAKRIVLKNKVECFPAVPMYIRNRIA